MSVEIFDIWYLGSAAMLEDDETATGNGGAIDKSVKMTFASIALSSADTVYAVSESAADTAPIVKVWGRDGAGIKVDSGSELDLDGQTPVESTQVFERIMKVTLESGSPAGNIAVYPSQAADLTGTCDAAGTVNTVKLTAGSATDNFYQFMILHLTGGTGANQIAEILAYDGTTKIATVRTLATAPDTDTVFDVRVGVVLEVAANGPDTTQIDEVTRVHYDASANPAGGADKTYYEKVFILNNHATLALTNAKIDEVDEGAYSKVTFALADTLDDSGTNGSNTRLVIPSSGIGSFDSNQKDVVNSGALSPGSGQGIWIATLLEDGDAADDTFWKCQLTGQSV